MGIYRILDDQGYKNIVQTNTVIDWDMALSMTPHRQPIITKATFYANKGDKYFRLVAENRYPNRSSELQSSGICSTVEVTSDEYEDAISKIGPNHIHKRW